MEALRNLIWPYFDEEFGQDGHLRSLPTWILLWSCKLNHSKSLHSLFIHSVERQRKLQKLGHIQQKINVSYKWEEMLSEATIVGTQEISLD